MVPVKQLLLFMLLLLLLMVVMMMMMMNDDDDDEDGGFEILTVKNSLVPEVWGPTSTEKPGSLLSGPLIR